MWAQRVQGTANLNLGSHSRGRQSPGGAQPQFRNSVKRKFSKGHLGQSDRGHERSKQPSFILQTYFGSYCMIHGRGRPPSGSIYYLCCRREMATTAVPRLGRQTGRHCLLTSSRSPSVRPRPSVCVRPGTRLQFDKVARDNSASHRRSVVTRDIADSRPPKCFETWERKAQFPRELRRRLSLAQNRCFRAAIFFLRFFLSSFPSSAFFRMGN